MEPIPFNVEAGAYVLPVHLLPGVLDVIAVVVLSFVVAQLAHVTYQLVCLVSRNRSNLRGVRK